GPGGDPGIPARQVPRDPAGLGPPAGFRNGSQQWRLPRRLYLAPTAMKHFHRSFLWRLLTACCLLTALVALGGHLVATGRISGLQGPQMGRRVALIAMSSGLATAACLYPLLVSLHQ